MRQQFNCGVAKLYLENIDSTRATDEHPRELLDRRIGHSSVASGNRQARWKKNLTVHGPILRRVRSNTAATDVGRPGGGGRWDGNHLPEVGDKGRENNGWPFTGIQRPATTAKVSPHFDPEITRACLFQRYHLAFQTSSRKATTVAYGRSSLSPPPAPLSSARDPPSPRVGLVERTRATPEGGLPVAATM